MDDINIKELKKVLRRAIFKSRNCPYKNQTVLTNCPKWWIEEAPRVLAEMSNEDVSTAQGTKHVLQLFGWDYPRNWEVIMWGKRSDWGDE